MAKGIDVVGTQEPDILAQGDIIGYWHAVRADHRYLRRDEAPYIFTFFEEGSVAAFSRYSEVRDIMRDNDHFVNRSGLSTRRLPPEDYDPPEHSHYRRLLDPHFSPRAVERLRPQITAKCNELIDAIVAKRECDFVAEFARPLPDSVFMHLLGVPETDLATFLRLKDAIVRPSGGTPEEMTANHAAASAELYAYYGAFLADKRADPGDDLLSRFLTTEVEGERLTEEDMLDIAFLLTIAGLDTVSSTLGCNFRFLALNPDKRLEILADPSLIPTAVEELLRWESPVYILRRLAKEDTEVIGCPIRAGEKATVSILSANHDEEQFPDAERVDFARAPNRHLAFAAGAHRCLGSHLARLELQVAMTEWHRRIPHYALAPGANPVPINYGVRTLESLPLVITAG